MTDMNMMFLPDEPINAADMDFLGFSDFVDLIENAIQYTQPPFVFGILGDWGVGKTSILQLLLSRYIKHYAEFKQRPSYEPDNENAYFVPIWFNVWKYENDTNIIYPMLHMIEKSYKLELNQTTTAQTTFGKKLSQIAKISTLVFSDILLRSASRPILGDEQALDLNSIRATVDDILSDEQNSATKNILSGWTNTVDQLETAFTDLLDQYAKDLAEKVRVNHSKIRFIIIIDDLDRCFPETTIKLLESIKNFFSVKGNVIFVLGLNPQVVYQGISHKYNGLGINGREYLEKILNYTFYVPEPNLQDIQNFALHRIEALIPEKKNHEIFKQYFHTFGQILFECNFTNPRKIKRILNRYLLFIKKYGDELDKYFLPNIVRLIIIAEYFPEIFQLFLSNAKNAQEDIKNVLDGTMEASGLENRTGIRLSSIYGRLNRIRSLVDDLPEQSDKSKHNLAKQVEAVFGITRLM